METRRDALRLAVAGTLAAPVLAKAAPASPEFAASQEAACGQTIPTWGTGIESQRKADLGNGRFLNPILSGDHPDPTVLKDGDDYYMTHSSFDAAPGLLVWHSRDLVNWSPVGPALTKPLGTVFAPDLIKHDGRYYVYIPFMRAPCQRPSRTSRISMSSMRHPSGDHGANPSTLESVG